MNRFILWVVKNYGMFRKGGLLQVRYFTRWDIRFRMMSSEEASSMDLKITVLQLVLSLDLIIRIHRLMSMMHSRYGKQLRLFPEYLREENFWNMVQRHFRKEVTIRFRDYM